MSIASLLLPEFQEEMKKTRTALAALPEDRGDFKVHAKSMALPKLAGHLAQMPGFISLVLTGPDFDLGVSKIPSLVFESTEQVLAAFDGASAQAETDLKGATDERMDEQWKLTYGDHVIYSGSRYNAYRTMAINHMVHHRAQIGVYLRLMDCPVPSTYGPSADTMS